MQALLTVVICCLITLSSGRSQGHKEQNSLGENPNLMHTQTDLAPALLLQQTQQAQHKTNQSPEQIKVQIPILRNGLEQQAIDAQSIDHSMLHQQQFPFHIQPRKHYKIMVILRRPTPIPPVQAIVPEVEEETLIYVLVRKPDEPAATDLQQIQPAQRDDIKLNKPEVYFINYKTSSENQQIPPQLKEPSSSLNASDVQQQRVQEFSRINTDEITKKP